MTEKTKNTHRQDIKALWIGESIKTQNHWMIEKLAEAHAFMVEVKLATKGDYIPGLSEARIKIESCQGLADAIKENTAARK